jgi:cation transport ATPase
VTVSHPPSLEERAQRIQEREQKRLLRRILLALVIAIPTFILGVVFMSLVKKRNSVRAYLEEPMWAGSASRLEWALFILATPVMFFAADLFHQRSIKEIASLWRRGSTTPLYRRFTRFGSMNLLASFAFLRLESLAFNRRGSQVSLGISIAYFASVALLGIAASRPRTGGATSRPMSAETTTTYFDSVVFLTLFILAGTFRHS